MIAPLQSLIANARTRSAPTPARAPELGARPELEPYYPQQETLIEENRRARRLINVTFPWCVAGVALLVAAGAMTTLWRLMPLKEVITPVVAHDPMANKIRVFDGEAFKRLSEDDARIAGDIYEWIVNGETRDARLKEYQQGYMWGRSSKKVYTAWRERRDADLALSEAIVNVEVTEIFPLSKEHGIYSVEYYTRHRAWRGDKRECQTDHVLDKSDCISETRAPWTAKLTIAFNDKPVAMNTAWKNPGGFVVLEYEPHPTRAN